MKVLLRYWHKLSLLTRALLIVFLLNGVAYTKRYLSLNTQRMDSWHPMIKALEHLHESPESPVYSKIFFEERTKFQYPPSSLLILELIRVLPGISWLGTVRLLNFLSWLSVLLIGVLSYKLLDNSSHAISNPKLNNTSKIDSIALLFIVVLITMTYYPITRSFFLGQIQTVLTFLGTVSLVAWQYKKKKTAGLLIGLICAIKPQWGILLLWGRTSETMGDGNSWSIDTHYPYSYLGIHVWSSPFCGLFICSFFSFSTRRSLFPESVCERIVKSPLFQRK